MQNRNMPSVVPVARGLSIETAFNPNLPRSLDDICRTLNQDDSDLLSQELRKLVIAWQRSGPNLRKMLASHETLAVRVRCGNTFLVATENGNGHLGWEPIGFGNPVGWDGVALRYFLYLVVHPAWWRLGGPCARCGRYYVKRRTSQKTYCRRRCGFAATATAATKTRRLEIHGRKLRRARVLARRWTRSGTRLDWKKWIARREPSLSSQFLTRAVNKGELQQPSEKRRVRGEHTSAKS
jgi:hypothetical protein